MPHDSKPVTQKLLKQVIIGFVIALCAIVLGTLAGFFISENLISANQDELRKNQIAGCYRANDRIRQLNSVSENLRSLSNVVTNVLDGIDSTPENAEQFRIASRLSNDIARNIVVFTTVDCDAAYEVR